MSASVTKTVLVVEDEKPINELLFDYLNEEGYKVLQAFDVLEALKILEGINCDLITLDYNLPAINGNQFLGLLPETAQNIPIIAITADPDKIQRHPQVKAVIAKPFDLEKLTTIITEVLKTNEDQS